MKSLSALAIILMVFTTVRTYKLNVPKVLLPYRASQASPASVNSVASVNFTLEITDIDYAGSACFEWRSSRPEVAAVHLLNDGQGNKRKCALRAVVSAVSQQSFRRTAIVSAEDLHSGTILRCDVIVDELHSLEIVTTTRQLYLEDSPELFIVRAKNSEGDTFADLDGLSFEWKVDSASSASSLDPHAPPARIVPFADSEYETTPAIRKLESDGLYGDRILVEGRSTGVAKISVRSRDDPYRTSIPICSIQLTVMAFLALEPSADLRLPIGSRLRYTLKLIRHKKADIVPLPSPLYRINLETIDSVDGAEVGRFHDATSTFEALALGTARLSVEDKKLEVAVAKYDLPSAYIYIVEPAGIIFLVSTSSWVFEVGRSYELTVQLVDNQGRLLFVTDNMLLDVHFPTDLLKAKQLSSKNGTVWRVKALKEGVGVIEASHNSYLDGHGNLVTLEDTIQGSRSFEIYSPISIIPPMLVFPSCYKTSSPSTSGTCFEKDLTANGGSGHFVWMLEMKEPINAARIRLETVSDRNVTVSTTNGGPVIAVAVAADTKNRLHRANAKIIVADPAKAEFIDGPREVEVGSILYLRLRVYGGIRMSDEQLVPFTDCSRMSFDVRLSNEAALSQILKTDLIGGDAKNDSGCVTLPFSARDIGDVTVSVNIHSPNRDTITATATVSVYAPLRLVSPPVGPLVLTPASSYYVQFTGGPRRLFLDPGSHFVVVERLGKAGADYFETSSVSETSGGDQKKAYSFMVTCLSYVPIPSEAPLLISVGNRKTPTNPCPALSSLNIHVICDLPASMALQLKRKGQDGGLELPPCPLDGISNSAAVPVYFGTKFNVLAILFNRDGMKIHNASALEFAWRVSDTSIVRAPQTRPHQLHWRAATEQDGVYEFYETFQPNGVEGIIKVTAELAGILKESCLDKQCQDLSKRSLKASLFLRLSPYATLDPLDLVLYNDPRSRGSITIRGGSGNYHIESSKRDSDMITWRILDNGRILEIRPSSVGSLGQTVLTVYDVCLPEAAPTTATISISSIEKLLLAGPSFVMLGDRLHLRILAFDGLDRPVSVEEIFGFLPLDVKVDGAGLVMSKATKDLALATLSFDAANVGEVSVTVAVDDPNKGHTIRSLPHRVQVFPAFRLEPQFVALVADAKFQLRITGGLQYSQSSWFVDPASSGVTFTVNDTKVATVRSDGLVEAKRPGVIAVSAILANPEKANDILAQDTVTIRVIRIASMKIHSPVSTVYVGSIVPLSFIGHGSIDPASSSAPTTLYPWGTAGSDIPSSWSVEGEGAQLDIRHSDSISGTIRLHCSRPGVIRIRLSVEQPNMEMAKLQFSSGSISLRTGGKLNASLIITVAEEMRFDHSTVWKHSGQLPPRLLMTQNATFPLQFVEPLINTDYRFYDNHESLVTAHGDGTLTSNGIIGDTVLTVSGKRKSISNINEIASLIVSVRPVSYLLTSAHHWPVWQQNEWPVDLFPIQYTLKFRIQYHDHHGSRFGAARRVHKLAVRPNRFDFADVSLVMGDEDEAVVTVRLKAVGETVIKIWDNERPELLSEYVHISAIHSIQPSLSIFQMGQKICFTNSVFSHSSSTNIHWSSSDPAVVAVDSKIGTALAKSPGKSTISHTLQLDGLDNFTTSTVVAVAEPTSITILSSKEQQFFVDDAAVPEHIYHVTFQSNDKTAEIECPTDWNADTSGHSVPHSCAIQVLPPSPLSTSLFQAEAMYAPSIGLACMVRRREGSTASTSVDMDADRNISIWASRGSLVSNMLTYPLHPAIIIQPTELWFDSEQSPKATIRLSSPNPERLARIKVTLSADSRTLLFVDKVAKYGEKVAQQQQADSTPRMEYTISLQEAASMDLSAMGMKPADYHILITDGTTGISHQIPIRFTLHVKVAGTEEGPSRGLLGFLWNLFLGTRDVYGTMLIVVVSVALTIISVHYGYKFVLAATSQVPDATRSSPYSVSPTSVQWRSYASKGLQSPRLWSLDRTQSPPSSMQPTPESLLTLRRKL